MSMEIVRFTARCPDCGLDAAWVGAPTTRGDTSYTIKCPSGNPPAPRPEEKPT